MYRLRHYERGGAAGVAAQDPGFKKVPRLDQVHYVSVMVSSYL
jgi:hypothetical protein